MSFDVSSLTNYVNEQSTDLISRLYFEKTSSDYFTFQSGVKKTDALLEGHFVLSSGLHSSKYIQCAKLLSHPKIASKICLSLAQKIKKKFKKIYLILAPAVGGIIIGYEIGRILNKETIFC